MFDDLIIKANELLTGGQAFAIAVVVRYEAPISGKPGDKALILADGKIFGWIGGGCTQPAVITEAQNALKDGKPRFVRVSPTSSSDQLEGIVEYNMTCHSGGTLDVYIEPVLPKPQLVILGKSPVAQTLAKLGKVLHYRVAVVAPGAEKQFFPTADVIFNKIDLGELQFTPQTFIVVSTQGQHDEAALETALKTSVSYIAFVASRKKADSLFDYLREKGFPEDHIKKIRVPAGLDIKAHLPEEIAVSILAEIIQTLRSAPAVENKGELSETTTANPTATHAKDPVCGMMVEIFGALHHFDYNGETYYFCCGGCQKSFQNNPQHYLATSENKNLMKDPVCGMTVEALSARHTSQYQNETYYFCCPGCKRLFDKHPEKYLVAAG